MTIAITVFFNYWSRTINFNFTEVTVNIEGEASAVSISSLVVVDDVLSMCMTGGGEDGREGIYCEVVVLET